MKRFRPLLCLLLILALTLSGCIVIPRPRNFDIPAEQVASVNIYDLRSLEFSPGSGFHNDHSPNWTLPPESLEAFLTDFATLEFDDPLLIALGAIDPSFFYGEWVVRVNYTDGAYTFFSCDGYGETFDASGELLDTFHFSADDEALENLILQYYTP